MAASEPDLSAAVNSRTYEDLPGPKGIPVFGNLLQIESTRVHLQLEEWCALYGPVFRLKLGKRRVVVISDHDLIADVLRDRPEGFRRTSRLEEISSEIGMRGGLFFVNDAEEWRRQRRMVMAGFDPAHVRDYFPSMQRVAASLGDRWQKAALEGARIDLQADLMRYTVDTIAGLAFGADVNTLRSDEDVIQRHLNRIFPALFKRVFAPFPLWRYLPSNSDRALRRSVAAVNAAVETFIAQARARLEADPARRDRPRNLLEAMLVAADEPGSGIDDEQVAGNVMVMLLAGEDTTANTLAWMIHLLWRQPSSLARATEEVRRICGNGEPPTFEQLGQMEFVDACTQETMRLKPVGPINVLQALRDTNLGDVRVSTGTVVMSLMRHDAVNDALLAKAKMFAPDRWLAKSSWPEEANLAKRLSMPFGAGPRICPGRYLALLEIKIAIATLLGRFDIQSVDTLDGLEPRESLQLSMGPVGLTMSVRARDAAIPVNPGA